MKWRVDRSVTNQSVVLQLAPFFGDVSEVVEGGRGSFDCGVGLNFLAFRELGAGH